MKTLAALPTLTPNLSHWDYSLAGSLSPTAGWRGYRLYYIQLNLQWQWCQ